MPNYVSADHIAKQGGAFEPQRKNNFTLTLAPPSSLNVDLIQKSLESFPFPTESNDPIVINFGNETRKVAGIAKFDDLSLVLKDFVDQPVAKQMIAWRRLVYTPKDGKIGWAKNYKGTGEVKLFGPDGTTERTWKLTGVWPSKLETGGGDMSSNTNNMITTTLTIDQAIEQ